MMKKTLFSIVIFTTNFMFGQLNIFENFDGSLNLPVGFTGNTGGIEDNTEYACSGNNALFMSAVYIPYFVTYRSSNNIVIDKDIELKFNYNYLKPYSRGLDLEVSYKLLYPNGSPYYEDTLPSVIISHYPPNKNTTCNDYIVTIPKSKIKVANSSIKITFKLLSSQNTTWYTYMWIDNFSLSQSSSLGLEEIQPKYKLFSYPNPTSKILNIINPKDGTNKVEIYDMFGNLILNKIFISSEDKISVDIESFPKGTYICKIGKLSSKFIKN
ncbi:T9SS type A sorting domain-containing protein [Riemerella anatipestifer]|nr:T9SS type A sorting domain-containing protein [Riemerella anatipestifer]MDY3534218.1 T9SS type A sorting domain-containing protein [Riemerella anatipestifer]MDY3536279.1 T9SS type A sorting domain-containing protein [Riemerella anatipestifer]